jgi:hypothetical protein
MERATWVHARTVAEQLYPGILKARLGRIRPAAARIRPGGAPALGRFQGVRATALHMVDGGRSAPLCCTWWTGAPPVGVLHMVMPVGVVQTITGG